MSFSSATPISSHHSPKPFDLLPEYKVQWSMPWGKPRICNRIQFICTFIQFGFYMLIIPFKTMLNEERNDYQIKYSIIQLPLCFLMMVLGIFQPLSRIRKIFQGNFDAQPLLYIELVDKLIFLSGISIFYLNLWVYPSRWTNLLKKCQQRKYLTQTFKIAGIRTKYISTFLCIFSIFVAVFTIIHENSSLRRGQLYLFISEMAENVRYTYFLPEKWFWFSEKGSEVNFSLGEYIAGPIGIIVCLYFNILFCFFLLLILLSSLMLFEATVEFESFLQHEFDIDKVLDRYTMLREQVKGVNGICGALVLNHVIRSMTFYSTYLTKTFNSTDWMEISLSIFHMTRFVVSLMLAAAACSGGKKIEDWLKLGGRYRKITPGTLAVVLNEVSNDTIGLKGLNFFTVTYSFIGSILSMLLTYFLINIQFQAAIVQEQESPKA